LAARRPSHERQQAGKAGIFQDDKYKRSNSLTMQADAARLICHRDLPFTRLPHFPANCQLSAAHASIRP
jgi:hypothetical protein